MQIQIPQPGPKRNFTKQEYSQLFNSILGTNIDWTKLSKDELAQLYMLLANPEILLKRLGIQVERRLIRERVAEVVREFLQNVRAEGPIIAFLRDLLAASDSVGQPKFKTPSPGK